MNKLEVFANWGRGFFQNIGKAEGQDDNQIKVSTPDQIPPVANGGNGGKLFYHVDSSLLRAIYHGYPDEDLCASDRELFAVEKEITENHLLYADVRYLHRDKQLRISTSSMHAYDIWFSVLPNDWRPSPELQRHRDRVVEHFLELNKFRIIDGEVENNDTARVESIINNGSEVEFRLQRCKYQDQVGTNISVDWDSGELAERPGATIRNTVEPPIDGRLPTFAESRLANTIGVAAILLDRDNNVFIRRRNPEMGSINQAKYHCSVSGVLEITDKTPDRPYSFEHVVQRAMHSEFASELNMEEDDYNLYPVAFARELPRAGKPQFFFVAKTHWTYREITKKARDAPEAWEISEDVQESFGQAQRDDFTYEGFAANWFAEKFYQKNKSLFD